MFTKKLLLCALIATGMIGGVATSLPAVADVEIQLNFGPPPPRYEAVPPPRAGYLWAPGHWQWSSSARTHVWVRGHWEPVRTGYVYREPVWVERSGRWYYSGARWDRDGDGIPNHRDPTPYGSRPRDSDRDGIPDRRDPTPYGSRPRDSDGDGVPDRSDARPNNPYRY